MLLQGLYVHTSSGAVHDLPCILTLAHSYQWMSGLEFLHQPPDQRPTMPIVSEAEPESVERKSIFNGITSEAQTFLVRLSSTPGMISSILLSSNCRSADSDASISAEKFLFDQDSFLTLTKPVDPLKLSVVRLHSDLNMTKPKDHDGGRLAACKGSRSRC